MIDTKEKFKNKYINLSNKELNGEVTKEIYNMLQQSMTAIGFEDLELIDRHFDYIKKHFKQIIVSDDAICSVDCLQWLRNKTRLLNHEKYKNYKEVSIHDIAGMKKEKPAHDINVKVCTKCFEELSVDEFHTDRQSKDGFYSHCKKCRKENATRDVDKLQEQRRKYYGK